MRRMKHVSRSFLFAKSAESRGIRHIHQVTRGLNFQETDREGAARHRLEQLCARRIPRAKWCEAGKTIGAGDELLPWI